MAGTARCTPAGDIATATADRGVSSFVPSVWGDFFLKYTPSISERSKEWMTHRADLLKEEVRQMFETSKAIGTAETLTLVDTLERLGIDNHFENEINTALNCIHSEELEFETSSDLHTVALRFRLLRQHGFWVSADIFNKFRDDTGCFGETVRSDPRSMLSLYNAAHLAAPGEEILDEAISLSRRQPKSMKCYIRSPLADQVSRALDIPQPRVPKRMETMHYIVEYEKEELHNDTVLELARLEFNLVRSLHLKELKALSLWWRDLYGAVKLSYARDRLVENYFWTCCVFEEEEYSRARIMLAKIFGLCSLMDDTYDVYATLEECQKLNEAIQRWDESAVSILPDYLRMFYIKLLRNFDELEDSLEAHEKYRMFYAKKAYKLLSKYYLDEAEWSNENHEPNFKEHVEVSVMSSGYPTLAVMVLVGMGDMVTKETFEWAIGVPDMVSASGEVARFLNDIASYKGWKNQNDVASSVECYVEDHGTTGEEAVAAITTMVEHAWRRMNQSCMEMDHALLPAAQLVVKLTRVLEIIYLRGRDAYTSGGDLKDLVTSLFLKPVPI
ncbi:hypothetical protein ACP70R_002633 [Stipagrostis hirtigluma subsp. patula]